MENLRIVVLDDDPTGTQTVHDIDIYTDWEESTLRAALESGQKMFFILTNSRSFTQAQTIQVHREIGARLHRLAAEKGLRLAVISRSDSTLRGHYPAETEALREGLDERFDGEIIMPFFPESGRYTRDNIHYVQQQDGTLTPAGETEFAKDRTFGYRSSHLGQWVEEKTGGRFPAGACLYIPVHATEDFALTQLLKAKDFQKIIVNAMSYEDVRVFVSALMKALELDRKYLYRTAAAFPKIMGGIEDQPFLNAQTISDMDTGRGGLVIIGSHVQKTTQQLHALQTRHPELAYYEFDAKRAMDPDQAKVLAKEAAQFVQSHIENGQTAVVYTSRKRIDLSSATGDQQLQASVQISEALTSIPSLLSLRPRYLIAKGGITSSDIATKALRIHRAKVIGQVAPGVPVWLTGPESLFPGLSYIIFPGNVGTVDSLEQIVTMLETNPGNAE